MMIHREILHATDLLRAFYIRTNFTKEKKNVSSLVLRNIVSTLYCIYYVPNYLSRQHAVA
jgi:hypothetical protein